MRNALFKVPEFDWNTEFRKELKDMLHNYFTTTYPGVPVRESSKATPTRYFVRALNLNFLRLFQLLFSLLCLRLVMMYYHFTSWSLWTVILYPIAEWLWDSNVFHDVCKFRTGSQAKTFLGQPQCHLPELYDKFYRKLFHFLSYLDFYVVHATHSLSPSFYEYYWLRP